MASRMRDMLDRRGGGGRRGGVALLAASGLLAIALLVVGVSFVSAFKAVAPDEVCVVQEGGPLDGRDVKEVRQPSSGVKHVGIYNAQRCFPATERQYTLSANPAEADSRTVDRFATPTLDAQTVFVEGQVRFTLNTAPDVVESFYKRYGVRTFNGVHPYDGDGGWEEFLSQVFRPVLFNALRQAVGQYRCVELNNTCQYAVEIEAATEGRVREVENTQNLEKIQAEVAETLRQRLNATLGGAYFENIRFTVSQVTFEPAVQEAITKAQTKRTDVSTARLEAQKQLEEARGRRRVAQEEARAIRIKARSYRSNPAQADIDKIRAFCGNEGCDPQAVGGDFLNSLQGGR